MVNMSMNRAKKRQENADFIFFSSMDRFFCLIVFGDLRDNILDTPGLPSPQDKENADENFGQCSETIRGK